MDFRKIVVPVGTIRRHMANPRYRGHRQPTTAPPVAMPGDDDPTSGIPRWGVEVGQENLQSILMDAQRRGGR